MAKTVLIGCSNVKTPAIDIQVIGVSDREYDETHEGLTSIRDVIQVTDSDVNISVPVIIAVRPRTVNQSSEVQESDPNTTLYFIDSGAISVAFTVKTDIVHITLVRTSALNTVTILPESGTIDGLPSITLSYLSPKDIYFDGTNFWTK